METGKEQKTYAFIASYLLGAERRTLEKEYVEDYIYSEGLEKFKNVENANLLRVLSKVKQSILRNYNVYRDAKDFSAASKGFLDEDKAMLLEHNIDLDKEFRLHLNVTDVVNLLSKEINKYLWSVLDYFNFPYSDKVIQLFQFPETDKRSLAQILNLVKGEWTKQPNGLFILRAGRVPQKTDMLVNDYNMFVAAHMLTGDKFVDIGEYESYNWDTIKMSSIQQKIPLQKNTLIYVDCDNTDYFKFLSVIESLNASAGVGAKHHIKLFIDEKANPVWRLTKKFVTGCFTIEVIEVSRIKDNKSVVDMVMAAHITRDAISKSSKQQVIFSSDSDFYGLLEFGIDLFVMYDVTTTKVGYLNYLKRRNMGMFDISTLDNDLTRLKFKQSIISHLCITQIASLPLNRWTPQDLAEFVVSEFDKEIWYGLTLQYIEAKDIANQVLADLKIGMKGNKVTISSQGVDVEVEIGVA